MGTHIPIRECICCRVKGEKKSFIRIAKTQEGFYVDHTYKMQGRGAYICKTCLGNPQFLKKRPLDRAFRQKVPDIVYTMLSEAEEGRKDR